MCGGDAAFTKLLWTLVILCYTHVEYRYCCLKNPVPSELWHCWWRVRKSIRPVKIEWWGVGELICLERGADFVCTWSSWCHCHPQTPSSLASLKSRLLLPFWYRLTQVVPENRPLNVCVCVFKESSGNLSAVWGGWRRRPRSQVGSWNGCRIRGDRRQQAEWHRRSASDSCDFTTDNAALLITDCLSCGFTSHSTQNRSLWRRFPHRQTWLFSSASTYHSTELLTARGVVHLVVHGTSGSTSYETIAHVQLETSGDAMDMVVQRRDGSRRLCKLDDKSPFSKEKITEEKWEEIG